MEKIKSVFSNLAAWVKSHVKVIAIVAVVILVAVIALNFVGGSEKRAIKKYIAAVNSCDQDKILKAIDAKASIAWANTKSYSEDAVKDFKDQLEDVDDDDVESFEKAVKKSIDKDNKGKSKVELLKVVYSTPAKDEKSLKKVVCKVRTTIPPSDDEDKEDAKEDSIWKNEKDYKAVSETYQVFYLYKNKVITTDFSSSYDYSDLFNY